MGSGPLLVILMATTMVLCKHNHQNADDIHGGVQMGIPDNGCDNGQTNLTVDWDDSTDFEERCQPGERPRTVDNQQIPPREECLKEEDIPQPLHMCMNKRIEYPDTPPRAGPHRPLWPVYGEYSYLPPQRWVHALEHGAAVFLYHPCADPEQIRSLKNVAKSCLRKHIITPYRELDSSTSYAVVTYGCRLLMSNFNEVRAKKFVRERAMSAPEKNVYRHGDYDHGLLEKAEVVIDRHDKTICPGPSEVTMDEWLNVENVE